MLSLPFALRYRLAYDATMLGKVLAVLTRTVFSSYVCRAREVGIDHAQCGAVTFIQRFGGSLNLNVHFHMLALDGVYAPGREDQPEFFPLRAPEDKEVARIASALAKGIPALWKRQGLGAQEGAQESDPDNPDRLSQDEPWLAALYTASVCGRIGRRATAAGDAIDPESMDAASPRCAASLRHERNGGRRSFPKVGPEPFLTHNSRLLSVAGHH
jgi:hypothetical protein